MLRHYSEAFGLISQSAIIAVALGFGNPDNTVSVVLYLLIASIANTKLFLWWGLEEDKSPFF